MPVSNLFFCNSLSIIRDYQPKVVKICLSDFVFNSFLQFIGNKSKKINCQIRSFLFCRYLVSERKPPNFLPITISSYQE